MNNGNREFLYIHLRRGNSCSTCPPLSLSMRFASHSSHGQFFRLRCFCSTLCAFLLLPLLHTPVISSLRSFLIRLLQVATYFELFIVSIFLFILLKFFGGLVVQTWEIVEELTLEDVVLGFFLFVLCCTHSRFWELGFFSFPVLACELLLFGGGL
jgi:hypothetical protein